MSLDLKHALESRIKVINYAYLMPGGDPDEKLIALGRIKELQFIIKLICANKIAAEITKHAD